VRNSTFTIGFVCHADLELVDRTIPMNIKSLCEGTKESVDVIVSVDGANAEQKAWYLEAATRWGVDEIRFRSRRRNCAGGDPSNNGHAHLLGAKSPYLITLEGDVGLFNLEGPAFDVLAEFRALFERHPTLPLATRMDDTECWVWPLQDAGPPLEAGIRSVNRVSSHFLVYATERIRRVWDVEDTFDITSFTDDGKCGFNYEDYLSRLARPNGPGIAFVDRFPIRVFHCDRKTNVGSSQYTKDLAVKCAELEQRIQQMEEKRS